MLHLNEQASQIKEMAEFLFEVSQGTKEPAIWMQTSCRRVKRGQLRRKMRLLEMLSMNLESMEASIEISGGIGMSETGFVVFSHRLVHDIGAG